MLLSLTLGTEAAGAVVANGVQARAAMPEFLFAFTWAAERLQRAVTWLFLVALFFADPRIGAFLSVLTTGLGRAILLGSPRRIVAATGPPNRTRSCRLQFV